MRKVSYREVFHADNYHGLELDPRLMVSDSLSVEETLDRVAKIKSHVRASKLR